MNSLRKLFFLIIGVVTLSLVTGLIATGWTGPGDAAPYSNAPAPVNIGSDSQTKDGEFISNSQITAGSFFTAGNIEGTSLDVSSLSVLSNGNINIGEGDFVITSGVGDNVRIGATTTFMQDHNLILEQTHEEEPFDALSSDDYNGVIYKGSQRFIHNYSNDELCAVPSDKTKDGGRNLFVGINAGNFNLSHCSTDPEDVTPYGKQNTGIGYGSLENLTSGYKNTALGASSLNSNTSGYQNVAIGGQALSSNTTGYFNTAIGGDTLHNNINGDDNIAIGYRALYNNTTSSNIGIGKEALYNNTTGDFNTAVGQQALYFNTIGIQNNAFGNHALYSNTEGYYNTAIGHGPLYSNTTGHNNTAIGHNSLYSNTEGYYNTAIGRNSLYSNTTGDNNTAIGTSAGSSLTIGDENVIIGSASSAADPTDQNTIVIGANATGKGTHTVVLGNENITDTYIRGGLHLSKIDEPADPATGEAVMWIGNGNCAAWCDNVGSFYIKYNNGIEMDTGEIIVD